MARLKKEVYEDLVERGTVLNNNFQKMFIPESDFKKPHGRRDKMISGKSG